MSTTAFADPAATPLPPMPPLMIRASAGTGKTYQLTGRLLKILLSGASIDSILATTFTRKAAGEILSRLLESLAHAATDEKSLRSLREQICDTTANQNELDLSQNDVAELLQRILKDIHRLRICTLDSLFSQLARSFSFELRFPPGWQLTDEIAERWFTQQAIARMLDQFEESEVQSLFHMLSKGQADRQVATRLEQVVQQNFAGFRRAVRSAWKKLQLPSVPSQAEITAAIGVLETCAIGNKSGDKVLHNQAHSAQMELWDDIALATPVLGAGASQASGQPLVYYRKEVPPDVTAALGVLYNKARFEFVRRLKLQTEATGDILEAFDRNLMAIKQNARQFGFGDVAEQLSRWARQSQRGDDTTQMQTLALRMDATLDHVLLDEFQDTSPIQWDVLRVLAHRVVDGSSQRSFFCVGDTKQAIYGWRGGEARIFDAVKRELDGLVEQNQDTSYRSSPVITDLVTQVFHNLDRHPQFADAVDDPETSDQWKCLAVHQFQSAFRDHNAAHRDRRGYVQLATGPEQGENKAATDISHQRFVADRVAQIAADIPDRSIGILTRTNRSVGRLIYLLRQHGLDVSQEGGNPLIDSAAVELVLSAIRMCEHPGDLRWRFHLANSPLAEPLGLSPAIDSGQAISESRLSANRLRDRFEHQGIPATIGWLCESLLPACGQADRLRMRQLIGLAYEYQQSPQPRLMAFVELVSQRRVQRPRQSQIRVMTIHQAKGLEFDCVVLPELDGELSRRTQTCVSISSGPTDLASGVIRYVGNKQWTMLDRPWQQALGQSVAAGMTEALCTLYVALTRPKHALYAFIQTPRKSDFSNQSAAALLYHALEIEQSPEPNSVLYQCGDPNWHVHRSA